MNVIYKNIYVKEFNGNVKYTVKMAEFDSWKRDNRSGKLIVYKKHWHIFDGKIFMGNGNFSMWKCKQLKRQISEYMSLMSGIQQCRSAEDENPAAREEFELLKSNIKTALNL